MTSSDALDSRMGLALVTVLAGLVVAVHAAPGPDFSSWAPWAGLAKVAHGYLAYVGVNAGVTLGALTQEPLLRPARDVSADA